MKFQENRTWLSDCDCFRVKKIGRRYEVYSRNYPKGGWFFSGRFATLALAKARCREEQKFVAKFKLELEVRTP
jgi:hypothetical protein